MQPTANSAVTVQTTTTGGSRTFADRPTRPLKGLTHSVDHVVAIPAVVFILVVESMQVFNLQPRKLSALIFLSMGAPGGQFSAHFPKSDRLALWLERDIMFMNQASKLTIRPTLAAKGLQNM